MLESILQKQQKMRKYNFVINLLAFTEKKKWYTTQSTLSKYGKCFDFFSPVPMLFVLWYDFIKFFIVHLFAGLVVPDVPLEETEILRREASKHGIELVCLPLIFYVLFPLFQIMDKEFSNFQILYYMKYKLWSTAVGGSSLWW